MATLNNTWFQFNKKKKTIIKQIKSFCCRLTRVLFPTRRKSRLCLLFFFPTNLVTFSFFFLFRWRNVKFEFCRLKKITMGVKDLWTILMPFCDRKPLYELQGKTVAVDLSCWICEAQNISEFQIQPRMYLRLVWLGWLFFLLLLRFLQQKSVLSYLLLVADGSESCFCSGRKSARFEISNDCCSERGSVQRGATT